MIGEDTVGRTYNEMPRMHEQRSQLTAIRGIIRLLLFFFSLESDETVVNWHII